MKNHTDAYIVAGGRSSRFGSDKTVHLLNDKPMISHVLEALSPIFQKIVIISDEAEKFRHLGLEIIPDAVKGAGPAGGINSALASSPGKRCFVFAADMPYINTEFIKYMLEIQSSSDIIIPFHDGFYEPLHAIYSAACGEKIKKFIAGGERSLILFFKQLSIRAVTENEILRYGKPEKIFKNINSLNDIYPVQD